jgi:hypothetical protein
MECYLCKKIKEIYYKSNFIWRLRYWTEACLPGLMNERDSLYVFFSGYWWEEACIPVFQVTALLEGKYTAENAKIS